MRVGLVLAALVLCSSTVASDARSALPGAAWMPPHLNDTLPPGTWTELDPSPPISYGHAGIYDPVGARMIVVCGSELRNDVWSLPTAPGSLWSPIATTGTSPTPRKFASAIYDALYQRIILFGGQNGTSFNDVWQLTLGGTPTWTQLQPIGAPPSARFAHTAIYDPAGQRMIVFGGDDGSARNDVWELTLGLVPRWTQLTPSGTPPSARRYHSAIYNATSGRMIVFGGENGSPLGDTWSMSLQGTSAWSPVIAGGSAPAARWGHSAIFVPGQNAMIVFAGRTNTYENGVWKLSLNGLPTWSSLAPSGTPPVKRVQHSAIYDPVRNRMMVFGGINGSGDRADVWDLSVSPSIEWTDRTPLDDHLNRHANHVTVYDPVGQRLILYSGEDNDYVDDLWQLSLGATPKWTPLVAGGGHPVPRLGHVAVYDPDNARIVVALGSCCGGDLTNDVWSLSLGANPEWTQITFTGQDITSRVEATAVYDPIGHRMVVFGGFDFGFYNDVWTLSLTGTPQWTYLNPLGPHPPERQRHTAIYDEAGQRMIIFGGQHSDNNPSNDVWALSLSGTPTWTQLNPAGTPPPPMEEGAAIYDPVGQRMIVYGGDDANDVVQHDLWELTLGATPTWNKLPQGGALPGNREIMSLTYLPTNGSAVLVGGWQGDQYCRDSFLLNSIPCLGASFTQDPQSLNVGPGDAVQFNAVASAPGFQFQWLKDGLALTDGVNVLGSATANLSIAPAQLTDAGLYSARISNSCSSLESAPATLTVECNHAAAEVPNLMFGWWTFDDAPGSSIADLTHPGTTRNLGALTGGTRLPALVGGGLRCDAGGDGVMIPNAATTGFSLGTGAVSVEGWVFLRPGAGSNPRVILQKITSSLGFSFYIKNDKLGFQMSNIVGLATFEPAMPPMSEDAWHHVAVSVTRGTNGGRFYVDGAQVGIFSPTTRSITSTSNVYIGRSSAGTSAFLGDLDEVGVYAAAISATNVQNIWTARCAGKRRAFAVARASTQLCIDANDATLCPAIYNFANTDQSFTWNIQMASGCANQVQFTYTPSQSSGVVTVPAGGSLPLAITATATGPHSGFTSCYRLTVTSQADGGSFFVDGKIVGYPATLCATAPCVPPQVLARSGGPTQALTRSGGPLAESPPNTTLSGATAHFTVSNSGGSPATFDFRLDGIDPASGLPSDLLSLDGQSPGTPVTGSVVVPGNGSTDVSVGVSVDGYEPFLTHEVLLSSDLDLDTVLDPMVSVRITSTVDTTEATVSVDESIPAREALPLRSSPNPFRGTTEISFTVARAEPVTLTVFDLQGRRVRALATGTMTPGEHHLVWNGRNDDGVTSPSGLYFVRLTTGAVRQDIRVVRLR